ncbi:uncharacterized protein LOC116523969 [Thamnophis elegans]|uniref:uncharacterized protein LOC116523969 n=1 Tax=Thamnophis elegans TaxID=35005 RepID=UPI0013779B3A|nr:uncharacterized protein LOC116523969 [Thamnophis elegans]
MAVRVTDPKSPRQRPPVLASAPEELPQPPPYMAPRGVSLPATPQSLSLTYSRRTAPSTGDSTGQLPIEGIEQGLDAVITSMEQIRYKEKEEKAPLSSPDTMGPEFWEKKEKEMDQLLGAVGGEAEPVSARTRAKTETVFTAPLRRVDQFLVNPDDPSQVSTGSLFQHVPFTTSDLLNWKMHYGPYSAKPNEVAELVKTIVDTHHPTWLDLQQLMATLFNAEEREKIRNAVSNILKPDVPARTTLADFIEQRFPSKDPNWSPYDSHQLNLLLNYQQLIVKAVRIAGKPATNMSKPSLITQEATESPEAFYSRLVEAYQMYTPIDPTLPENARMLAMAFISQSAPDIRHKLQKLEGALGKPLSELMEVARKTFVNRDLLEERKKDKQMKKKAELLATALMTVPGGNRGSRERTIIPSLGQNQCAICHRAQIFFDEKGSVGVEYGNVNLEIPREEAWRIMVVQEVSGDKWREFRVPELWAEDNPPGFAAHHTPVIVEELPMSRPVCIRQRGYPREIVQAIQEVIQLYLTYKILVPTDSPWNSPILPIPKGGGKYRMAQDLRRVNSSTVTIYPTLPNPYVLLGLIPPKAKWFSVIDLKDAFFSIPIHKKSQHLFAFEWENPTTGRKQQYTWTRLPQGYKNSPTHFSAALATDLEILDLPPPDVVLQYVDDLLVTGQTEEDCHANTASLLLLLQEKGYKASRAKAQLVQLNVRYLGYDIQQGQRTLGHERKEAICQLPAPRNRKELRGFLGAAGFCRIWIPNFALLAKPLYEATKGSEKEPLRWEKEEQKSFLNLKHALTQAPSLGLPNLDKPFHLFVDTKQNMAVGVLTQKMGTWYRPVAYLSKQLDQVAKGWPSCLKAVAGTALLTQEANKLTFGQQLNIYTPHALRAVLDQKGHLWLTNPRMLKYQGLITHNPLIKLVQSYALNPATLLPEPDSEISHDCLQTIEETYASRPDLKDEPFSDPDATLFTDGTSFIHEGVRKAAYAIVTLDDVWEAKPLPAGTSAQLAELHALTRALELAKGLHVNIYTDSKYVFLTVQVHGALYKERGLITAGGKDIKYGPQILRLLDSVWSPKQVAVMHVRGHQKGISTAERGNHKADQVARAVALDPFSLQANCLTLWIPNQKDEPPLYSHSEVQQAEAIGAELVKGWWTLPDNRVFVPQQLAWEVVSSLHRHLHLGKTALRKALTREVYINNLSSLAAAVCSRCQVCAANNPRQGPSLPPGHQPRGAYPFDYLMIDFTDMPKVGSYTAMLVVVCTYTGWPECVPTRTKKALEVTRTLLNVVIPRYGLPSRISSDNGPEFIHAATQKVAQVLGITWKLHCSFHAQSAGVVERVNRTIKNKLAKLCQETHLKWPDALSMALLAVRCAPTRGLGVSPYELMYGRVPNLVSPQVLPTPQVADTVKVKQLQALNTVVHQLQKYVLSCRPHVIVTPVHNFHPGQEVWVKGWKKVPLEPKWCGPYTVVICSPLAVKVAEIKPWIHWTRLKLAATPCETVSKDSVQPLHPAKKRRRRKDAASPADSREAIALRPGGEDPSACVAPGAADTHRTGNALRLPWNLRPRPTR